MDVRKDVSPHGQWSSRWIYFLAATGSAVGLGNIWKFPYITGVYGGGAFVIVYLGCILLIGLPLLIAEAAIGRRARHSPAASLMTIARAEGRRYPRAWGAVGWLAALAGFLILSFYTVIAGWVVYYTLAALEGAFTQRSAVEITALFESHVARPWVVLAYSTGFLVATMVCVGLGVRRGLEASLRFSMPVLILLLVVLVIYATIEGDFAAGLQFLFRPDFSALTWPVVLVAMGHAFFSLGLGAGTMIIYGAYLPGTSSLPRTALEISLADTAVAMLAGLALFPIVFAHGLEPGVGPQLVFVTVPIAFGQMPGGVLIGTAFFLMLALAAFTSAISTIEPLMTTVVERFGCSRRQAACWLGAAVWLVSLGTVGSFSWWSEPLLFNRTAFELIDFLASNLMLPAGGLLVALFVGWLTVGDGWRGALLERSELSFRAWYWVLRYITPLGIAAVLIAALTGRT
ncbi:MAG: sodium-dependent transporter [Spongiibacteraceae bacterium]|jgi:NSS family neurotransmitter:Na+ symporter|nr:sodium-dependent transporter [Spongiibacteraceae bacterium]